MVKGIGELEPSAGPNTCQYVAETPRGDFLIQIAWPLSWSPLGVPPPDDGTPQSLFVVDGNAFFYTAVEVVRRMEFLQNNRTVVVGIGYPNTKAVFDFRRGPDLTPASAGGYEMPLDKDGKPRTDLKFGEASEHLNFIRKEVMDYVYGTLLPVPELRTGRKALFGHSYGGLFALNALFTAPELFSTIIAASPPTWWNSCSLTKEQEVSFRAREEAIESPPSLLLTWGYSAGDLTQHAGESDEAFQKRLGIPEDIRTKDGVLEVAARLRECQKLRTVMTYELPYEDHGSTSVTTLQMGILRFLRLEI